MTASVRPTQIDPSGENVKTSPNTRMAAEAIVDPIIRMALITARPPTHMRSGPVASPSRALSMNATAETSLKTYLTAVKPG